MCCHAVECTKGCLHVNARIEGKLGPFLGCNNTQGKPASFDQNGIQELKDNFPYRVIDVEGAEADDIIGTLCMEHGTILNSDEKILILSGDKDFVQP